MRWPLPRLAVAALLFVLLTVAAIVRTPEPVVAAPLTAVVARTALDAALQGLPGNQAVTPGGRTRHVAVRLDELPTPGPALDLRPGQPRFLRLDLFEDVSVVAELDRFDPNPRGTTWIGRVAGVPASSVTLVYGDGLMTGSIATPTGTYTIRPAPEDVRAATPLAAGALHVVSALDQSRSRPEAPPIATPAAQAARLSVQADEGPLPDPADVIDLMVVYTPGAEDWAGGPAGIQNLITLGVSETNTSYATSGVIHRLRLVHTALVPHLEVSSSLDTLAALQADTGAFAGVGALRDAHAADLVMLVQFSSSSFCGLAYMTSVPSTSFESTGFSLVEADCISPNYTFAHELGHNMGMRHDWHVDTGVAPFPHAHGHVHTGPPGERWRTIMSGSDLCMALGFTCQRLLAWSNPDLTQGGAPMGVPQGTSTACTLGSLTSNTCDADGRAVLNAMAPFVANFRQASPHAFATLWPSAGAVVVPGAHDFSWQPSDRATAYAYCIDTIDNDTCDTGWIDTGTSLSATIGPLGPDTTHYWQVRASNDTGIRLSNSGAWRSVRTGPAAGVNLTRNGDFIDGTLHWLTYATPDMSYIDASVVEGMLQFSRQPPPAGTSNQAVAFQETGVPQAAGAPLLARFDLGNTSSDRTRISVLLHDANFSDLAVCTFWLAPDTPLATYEMRTHTTQAWQNATISFYAATVNHNGGFYQVDNVSLEYAPAHAATRTDCVDPTAPAPAAEPDGSDLLVNGSFATGTLAAWTTFGTIDWSIDEGVLNVRRPTSDVPAGVVLQPTGSALEAGEVLTATFAVGNSSPVRKRLTVLLHDLDFSDLTACTFWIAPHQPLAAHAMRVFTGRAWTNATISLYPATIGPEPWTSIDQVTLHQTPGAAIVGTECLEPAIEPDAAHAVDAPAGEPSNPLSERAGTAVRDAEIAATPAGTADATGVLAVDLSDATDVRLSFDSWLSPEGASGFVQVSLDGLTWTSVARVDSSDTWIPVEVDLSSWTGAVLLTRFTSEPPASPDPGDAIRWRLDSIVIAIDGDTIAVQ